MTYYEKLKDPRWQKLRLEVFERENWTCQDCGSKDKTLHAHHVCYEKGKEPWEYPCYRLMCLCDECHEQKHSLMDSLPKVISFLPNRSIDIIGWISCHAESLAKLDKIEEVDKILNKAKLNLIKALAKESKRDSDLK